MRQVYLFTIQHEMEDKHVLFASTNGEFGDKAMKIVDEIYKDASWNPFGEDSVKLIETEEDFKKWIEDYFDDYDLEELYGEGK